MQLFNQKMKKGQIFITITIGILCFILVMVMFMQFKLVYQTDITSIETMRQEDLEEELSKWKIKYEEIEEQYKEVSETLQKYKEESNSDAQVKQNLEEELQKLELLLGTTDVRGDGIVISLNEKENSAKIDAEMLLRIVNILKSAGAEAIEINGERIVDSTYIVYIVSDGYGYNGYIKINDRAMNSPYVIKAIGDADHLKSPLQLKNGYIEKNIINNNISISIEEQRKITISKYTGNDLTTNYISESN